MNTRIKRLFAECIDEYNQFNQNDLISESKMIRFAKERGVNLTRGDLSLLIQRGLLSADNSNSHGYLFHPFRIYGFYIATSMSNFNIPPLSTLDRENLKSYLNVVSEYLPSLASIQSQIEKRNKIADLAILLEPVYWPKITNKTKLSIPNYSSLEEFELKIKPYKEKVLAFVKSLDIETWSSYHEYLRIEATKLDNNYELYMLLRLAPWNKRERITGNIGGALWFRHIAEVIRLAFEEVHGVQWAEEYEATSFWHEGARTKLYGSERPIENGLITRPRLAFEFGLHTGSTIRWYLEGETEYQAALYILPKAALAGIEFINLKGVFQENANAPMRLEDHLKSDRELKRFSFISFDGDVSRNVSFFGKQIEKDNIVGYINVNYPDFEFENFTLNELIEIAISLDEKQGFNSDRLKSGDRGSIISGKAFEKYYKEYSDRKNSLKGKEWGEALASYALDNPLKEDTNQRRTFLQTIDQILVVF